MCHDTLTVLEYLRRGFVSADLDSLLGLAEAPTPRPSARNDDDASDTSESVILEPVERASAHFESAQSESEPVRPRTFSAAATEAVAWLECADAESAPTAGQIRAVYATPQLFSGAARDCRGPQVLPGDGVTLRERLERIAGDVGELLTQSFLRTCSHTSVTTLCDVPAGPALLRAPNALRSAPAGFPGDDDGPAAFPLIHSAPLNAATFVCIQQTDAMSRVVLFRPDAGEVAAATVDVTSPRDGDVARVIDFAVRGDDELLLLQQRPGITLHSLRDVRLERTSADAMHALSMPQGDRVSAGPFSGTSPAELSSGTLWLAE